MPGIVSAILWGPTYENVLRIPYPLDGVRPGRPPRPGSVRDRLGDGTYAAWIEGRDYVLDAELRWTPWGDTSDPAGTGWSGPLGVEEFLAWAGGDKIFRFVPDASIPDVYVDQCSLVEPFQDPRGTPEQDGSFRVPITIINPTVPFSQALRGILFEYVPGTSLTDPVAYTFARSTTGLRIGVDGGVYEDAIDVLRDRHYVAGQRGALFEGTRQNKIENGGYEQDAIGTGQGACTVVRDGTNVRHGAWAAKVTTTDVANSGPFWLLRSLSRIPAVAARTYTVEVDVYAPAGAVGKQLRLNLEWWDSVPSQLGSALGATITLVAGWQRIITTALSPANTAFVTPSLYTVTAQGVFDYWVDLAHLEEGAFASEPVPTSTGVVTRNPDQLDRTVRVPMGIDWTLYLHFFARHANVASWADTEPQLDPFLIGLFPTGAASDTDNAGAMILHRQNGNAQYEWEYMANRASAARTFSVTPNAQKLVLRHYASDHHLDIAIDGGAFVAGAAPSTVVVPALQTLLRFRNAGFWTVFRAKLLTGLRSQAAAEAA